MIGQISFAGIAASYGGVLLMPDCPLSGLSTDTRKLQPGEVFLAIRGQNFDGHNFVDRAVEMGVAGLVVERPMRHLPTPQWVVEDSVQALGQIAREVRLASCAMVVGVTGSTGKTTVKSMLTEILALQGSVLATQGNLNNEIGVPLTLLGLQPEHRFAVVEMGAARLGDISYLGQIVEPNVALVNNIGVAHLERFGSRSNIVQAKGEIYESLAEDGVAVINLDTDGADHFCAISPTRQVHYSMRSGCGAHVWVENISVGPEGSHFELCTHDWKEPVRLQLLGQANIENALAAGAVARALDIEPGVISRGLSQVRPVPGRLCPRAGLQGAVVLDDSYNANPVSSKAAINVLAGFPGRRVLVLGKMGELGVDEKLLHEEVGAYARDMGVDLMLGLGELPAAACQAFGEASRIFASLEELAAFAREQMTAGDVWLIKGSRTAGLDRLVDIITKSEGSICSSG